MPFLPVGKQADLTSYRTGSYLVRRFAGRGKGGLPLWQLSCESCHLSFPIVEHRKLAAAIESGAALPCTNAQCPSKQNHSESFAEFNRRMRQEAEQTAKAAAEAAAKAGREAAERRAKEAQAEALKAEYREFFHHQMVSAGVFDELIPKWEKWQRLPTQDRARIMAAIRQRFDVKVSID